MRLPLILTCVWMLMRSRCAVPYGLYGRCWSSLSPLCADSLQGPAAAGGAQRQQQQQQQQHLHLSSENLRTGAAPHLCVVCCQPAGNKSPLQSRRSLHVPDTGAPPGVPCAFHMSHSITCCDFSSRLLPAPIPTVYIMKEHHVDSPSTGADASRTEVGLTRLETPSEAVHRQPAPSAHTLIWTPNKDCSYE